MKMNKKMSNKCIKVAFKSFNSIQIIRACNHSRGILDGHWILPAVAHCGGSPIFIFQRIFSSLGGVFISGGGGVD